MAIRVCSVLGMVFGLAIGSCRSDAPGSVSDTDGSGDSETHSIPNAPSDCEGFAAAPTSSPRVRLAGDDCTAAAVAAAVAGGGTIVIDCPAAPIVLTEQLEIRSDTIIDGSGVTVLDGGGTTRLFFKGPGPDLWLQNITLQNGHAPQALGDSQVTQANWFNWAGGAINVQCHNDEVAVGGGLHGKGLICRNSSTGASTRDPNTGQILDTGTGGCVYSFTCPFECDECEFTGNHGTNGGAIGTLGGKTRLTRSTCTGNEARFDDSTNNNRGFGGCYYQDGTETAPGEDQVNYVEFCGNGFADNVADVSGGAVQLFYRQHTHTSIEFVANLCQGNRAEGIDDEFGQGGCLYIYVDPDTKIPWAPDTGPDTLVISGNAIADNVAERLGGGVAIYNIWNTSVRFDNNEFMRNSVLSQDQSSGGGGALGLVGVFFDLEHNTFADNTAANWSGAIALGAGGVALRNNLFFRNAAPAIQGPGPLEQSEHVNWKLDELDDGSDQGFLVFNSAGNLFTPSKTQSGEPRPSPGAKIRDQDPLFGPQVDDERFPPFTPVMPGSPAIGAGVPLPTVTTDMRGQQRDPQTPDIGAYEHTP